MKGWVQAKKIFIFIILSIGWCFYAFAESSPAETPAGQIVWVKGVVKAISSDNNSRDLKRRDAVYAKDSIVTDSTSSGQIVFSDGGLMTVSPGTTMHIEEYKFAKNTSADNKSVIDVAKGGFRAITGAIAKTDPDSYKVKTPVATIGVRGTDYTIYYKSCINQIAGQNCGLASKINKGAIVVKNSVGQVVLVDGSNSIYAVVGKLTTAPAVSVQKPAMLKTNVVIEPANFGAPASPPSGPNIPSQPTGPVQQVGGFCIQ